MSQSLLTYGFRRTLPRMAGVTLGGAFMVGAVGIGLGAVFIAFRAEDHSEICRRRRGRDVRRPGVSRTHEAAPRHAREGFPLRGKML